MSYRRPQLSKPDAATDAKRLMELQAENEALWFDAQTITEAYLQAALRRLHAVIEGETTIEQALREERESMP